MSECSGSSSGSFFKKLDDTLKEGSKDVEHANKVLKKRDHGEANKPATKGTKLKFANKNDPCLILENLPSTIKAALMVMPPQQMERELLAYLDRQMGRLEMGVARDAVRKETTMIDKFVVLVDMLQGQGMHLE